VLVLVLCVQIRIPGPEYEYEYEYEHQMGSPARGLAPLAPPKRKSPWRLWFRQGLFLSKSAAD